ncbi:glycerophosphodiester phosphodiesterase [Rhodohalobacter sp. SW132]|uniref:glycerophosphodiester phosphodiesterase family protein n=1 Tax=Rhodohalobacter sp. SW132 TaxID=2293433 RepID=UPI000E22C936|nr:glycerophosphodiester phosphodiesterase family protein [Rhodohalobacter sp. SW132]REL37763.1 glycerophosphodiester phosphodiesterase [Rhodohalobacter sp. SW132]
MRAFLTLFALLIFSACTMEEITYDYDLQGHRGARGLLPENTIPSFLKAIDYRVDTIEFDLVVTGDNRILISHEPWFDHNISTKPDGTSVTEEEQMELNIYEMTYEETREYDVGKRGHAGFPEQEPMEATKPLMRDAIIAIEQYVEENGLEPVYYNIETKSRPEWYGVYGPQPQDFSRLLYDELAELEILDRVIIQSFDPATLIAMREIDPDVVQAMLVYEEDQTIDRYVEILGYQPEIWSPHYELVTPDLVAEVHEKGMTIIPWTINETEEMIRLLELGVDGIITDYPNRAP